MLLGGMEFLRRSIPQMKFIILTQSTDMWSQPLNMRGLQEGH